MPQHHSPEEAAAMVQRFAGTGTREAEEIEEADMVVYTVAEDRLRRRIGRIRREGMEQQRTLLRRQAARRFGSMRKDQRCPGTMARRDRPLSVLSPSTARSRRPSA